MKLRALAITFLALAIHWASAGLFFILGAAMTDLVCSGPGCLGFPFIVAPLAIIASIPVTWAALCAFLGATR